MNPLLTISLDQIKSSFSIGGLYQFKMSLLHFLGISIAKKSLIGSFSLPYPSMKRDYPYKKINLFELSSFFQMDFFIKKDISFLGTPFLNLSIGLISYRPSYYNVPSDYFFLHKSTFAIGYKLMSLFPWVLTSQLAIGYNRALDLIIDKENYQEKNKKDKKEFLNNRTFGVIQPNHWYILGKVSIVYTFGGRPCHCQ